MSVDHPNILLVEDDPSQREVLTYNLQAEDFKVICAGQWRGCFVIGGRRRTRSYSVGLDDAQSVGYRGVPPPQVTPQNSVYTDYYAVGQIRGMDKVHGLEIGADDYLVKPYSVVELIARVRAQLRRTRAASIGAALYFQDITLDPETHKVFRAETQIKLGPTEFRLLRTLMEKPGRVWSRDQLLDRVWGRDIYVDTRTVDVHIGRLRKALSQQGGKDVLRTVRGAGYALG